jgi:hypothetical protein
MNQYDYGFRIYDPRIGRFLSVDPITSDYPWYTPYQFAGNKPIAFTDLDGLEESPAAERMISWHTAAALGKTDAERLAIYKNLRGMNHGPDFSKIRKYWYRSTTAASQTIKAYEYVTGKPASFGFKAKTYFASFFSWNGGGDYTDADDVSVLAKGEHASGEPATLTDKILAGGGMVIPFLSGGAIRKMFTGVSKGIGQEAVEGILKKVDNISTALDEKHITAAVNDILGNPVINEATGKVYNHLQEVKDALQGLGNQIGQLNKLIDGGKLSDEILESAQKIRSELQKKKDDINAVLDRATKKANE